MLPHLTGQHPHLLTEGQPQVGHPASHPAQVTEVHLLTEVPAVPTTMAAEIQAPHTEARQAAPHTGVLPAASLAEDIPVVHPAQAEVAAAV